MDCDEIVLKRAARNITLYLLTLTGARPNELAWLVFNAETAF